LANNLRPVLEEASTREGFGLTVTEALWKGKPVIGGDTGGIRLQVTRHLHKYLTLMFATMHAGTDRIEL
jgi:hypothetical protein